MKTQGMMVVGFKGNNEDMDSDIFADDYLDIIFNGIKP